jgi:sugar-specific transcriptional regulator TrmB
MHEQLLEETGLTKNEASVYLALLRIGRAKAGEIIKESKVSSGKIYETLGKLIDKGLVKSFTENGVKHFLASEPESIISYIKEQETKLHKKEEELQKIIPALQSLRKDTLETEHLSLVKGFRGISPLVYQLMVDGKEIKVMGVRSSKDETFNNFWKHWHQKRIDLKKNAKMLFTDKDTDYWKYFKEQRHTEVRETLSFSPSAIMIIDANVLIFTYEEEFTCIHIQSEGIAKSFSCFFDGLWEFSGE